MTDIYTKITNQFSYLIDYGLVFTYSQSNGKLGDRTIDKFTYENPELGKKFEIVYCAANIYPSLYGFIVKSDDKNENLLDPQNFISFDRLRCFFGEGSEIIFFGIEQYELSYKLKEFKLVVDKFLTYITSNNWIDYTDLLNHEKKIYVLTLEQKKYYTWAEEIKSSDFVKSFITITFDSSLEPPYEAYGLKLKSKNDIEFHIMHGYKSRDDVGFSIQITYSDKRIENHELMNVSTNEVVEFIKNKVNLN